MARVRVDTPRLIGMAAELAALGPPVDHARIAQLRQAISDGSYAVDTRAIAAALLAGSPGRTE